MQEVIPTSLLKLSSENTGRAVKMFLGVQKFMGESSEGLQQNARFDLAQKLLHQVSHHGDKPYVLPYLLRYPLLFRCKPSGYCVLQETAGPFSAFGISG